MSLQECLELQAQNHADHPAARAGHAVHALVCACQAGHAIHQSATLAVCHPLQGQLASMALAPALLPQGTSPSMHMAHAGTQDVPSRQPGAPSLLGSGAAASCWLYVSLGPCCLCEHAFELETWSGSFAICQLKRHAWLPGQSARHAAVLLWPELWSAAVHGALSDAARG